MTSNWAGMTWRCALPAESKILKGSDGRRWLTVHGSGRVVELKDGAPPPKPKRKKIIKKGTKNA